MKNIDILYEDNFIIIVNKPAGLPVQGGKDVKSSLDRILANIRSPAPLLVHRLDKDTSGVLLAAKDRESAARFSGLLAKKAVKKYTAVCSGCLEKNEGVIAEELSVHGKIKKSITKYKVIKTGKLAVPQEAQSAPNNIEFSVVELELGTGRMHQIRRHLAMIGHPVLGDDKYGDFPLNKKLRKSGIKRLLLHAQRLIIYDKSNIDINSPLPGCFSPFT